MGGLSRRAYIIKQFPKENGKPFLALDAGELLFDKPVLPASQLSTKKEKARGIMQAMQAMGYSAIGVSARDLAAGSEFLKLLENEYKIPFLSMNLADKKSGELLFTPYVLKNTGDIKIGIIGLTGSTHILEKNSLLQNIKDIPWEDNLASYIRELSGHTDMIILLSSFPEGTNQSIAKQFKEIDIILQAGQSASNRPPRIVDETLLIQSAPKGKYAGQLDINWNTGKKWWQAGSTNMLLNQEQAKLKQVTWRLERMEKSSKISLENNAQYQELLKNKGEILEEMQQLEQQQKLGEKDLSTYSYTFIPLNNSLPQDGEVQQIISQIKYDTAAMNRKKMAEIRQKKSLKIPPSMTGWQKCVSCHPDQAKRWQQSRHARAWQSLAAKKQQFNRDCLICHVTLPTYVRDAVVEGDFLSTLAPELNGVGCEACHGPGKLHAQSPETNKLKIPAAGTCLVCHTPEQDDHFDFVRKSALLGCGREKK